VGGRRPAGARRARQELNAFGRELTIGIEEELFLVDARSLEAVPAVHEVVPEPSERVKLELFQCLVETTTPICRSAGEALDALQRLREDVAERADAHGLALLAAGSHPLARGEEQPLVDAPVYRKLAAALGDAVHRQLVCGLHVHVGLPDERACIHAYEGVLPWLPVVLSLAAASPYLDGAGAGARSGRAGRIAELPRASVPPVLVAWADYEALRREPGFDRMWWDARPHPDLGTLELRIADMQTDVRRSAGLGALCQALVAAVLELPVDPLDRDVYVRRREEGAHEALPLESLADLTERPARRLGGWELVEELLSAPAEAVRQLELGAGGDLDAVVADLADRTPP
jgi:glutamate---cysteine ligase / carboxylate-amine ligase